MPTGVTTRPYRLLMTADAIGGVWRYGLDAALCLSQAGVEVTLATLGPPASAEQREEAAAVAGVRLIETGEPLDWLCASRAEARRAAEAVARLARETDADLIQMNGTALAADATFDAPVAVVHHSCLATWWANVKGGPSPADWIWRCDLMRDHLHCASSVAAPTRAFAEETAATYALRETPRVIFNGRAPGEASASEPVAALFTAGRLWDEGKNVETIERAARRLAAPVFAAGPLEGPHGARVSLQAAKALGPLSEGAMRAQLAGRPVFVSTPLYEPFGLAVLEAAQAGCALILSDIPTLRELWGGAATFVPPRADAALARAAERLLGDAEFRAAEGAAARRRASHFSLQRFGEALFGWHRELLAHSRGRSAA